MTDTVLGFKVGAYVYADDQPDLKMRVLGVAWYGGEKISVQVGYILNGELKESWLDFWRLKAVE